MDTWQAWAIMLLAIACASAPGEPLANGTTGNEDAAPGTPLLVGANVDTLDRTDQSAIRCLRRFFSQKMLHEGVGDFWDEADSFRYAHIFNELRYAEYDSVGNLGYPPELTSVTVLGTEGDRLLHVVWALPGDPSGRARYAFDFHARKTAAGHRLCFPIDLYTAQWERHVRGTVTYVRSPKNAFSEAEARAQQRDIEQLVRFFGTAPFSITYYAFADPEDLYRSCGFTAHPLMGRISSGGMVDGAGNAYCGNGKEIFTHEIVHVFASRHHAPRCNLLEEGLATLLGSMGERDYAWYRADMRRYLASDEHMDLRDRCNTILRDTTPEGTSVPYMIGALLCERIIRTEGKADLLKAMASSEDHWVVLRPFGITPENLTAVLKEELEKPIAFTL